MRISNKCSGRLPGVAAEFWLSCTYFYCVPFFKALLVCESQSVNEIQQYFEMHKIFIIEFIYGDSV